MIGIYLRLEKVVCRNRCLENRRSGIGLACECVLYDVVFVDYRAKARRYVYVEQPTHPNVSHSCFLSHGQKKKLQCIPQCNVINKNKNQQVYQPRRGGHPRSKYPPTQVPNRKSPPRRATCWLVSHLPPARSPQHHKRRWGLRRHVKPDDWFQSPFSAYGSLCR
jgi:hypothetical protein